MRITEEGNNSSYEEDWWKSRNFRVKPFKISYKMSSLRRRTLKVFLGWNKAWFRTGVREKKKIRETGTLKPWLLLWGIGDAAEGFEMLGLWVGTKILCVLQIHGREFGFVLDIGNCSAVKLGYFCHGKVTRAK